MKIDRGSFLMLVSTLAIGAAGGYVAAEKRVFPALDRWRGRSPATPPAQALPHAESAPTQPLRVTAPSAAAPAPEPPAPTCDDSVATVDDCPPPGYPTIEGGCGSFATVRCRELKQAMKPKVAAAAVSCLNKLSARERCVPARVHLCGHLALMNACPEAERPSSAATSDAGTSAASSVAAICQGIIDECGASPVAPSMTECRQLLSGMTSTGRDRTRRCMKTHCLDRGLLGCEGIAPPK